MLGRAEHLNADYLAVRRIVDGNVIGESMRRDFRLTFNESDVQRVDFGVILDSHDPGSLGEPTARPDSVTACPPSRGESLIRPPAAGLPPIEALWRPQRAAFGGKTPPGGRAMGRGKN